MQWFLDFLRNHYLDLKFLHVFFVAMWSFSTVVAYVYYVVPAFKAAGRHPDDPEIITRRNWAMERFDRGVILEHIAFPIVLLTGLMLGWVAGWSLHAWTWFSAKMAIVALIFVPLEIVDYYVSHFGGNKERIRRTGDMARYDTMMGFHWSFFRFSAVFIGIFIPLTYYLAVAKPF